MPTAPDADWAPRRLDELCSLVSRGTAPTYVERSSVYAIGQRCITNTEFTAEYARAHDENAMNGVLEPLAGDVLLNSTGTGTIGRSCTFNASGRFIVDGHVTLMRPRNTQADGRWLNEVLRSPWGQAYMETMCYTGSTNQIELSHSRLIEGKVLAPRVTEQRDIARILDIASEAIYRTQRLAAKLRQTRQGLLQDLLAWGIDENGEVRGTGDGSVGEAKPSPLGPIPTDWTVRPGHDVCHRIEVGIVVRPTQYYVGHGVPMLRSANVRDDGLTMSDLVFMSQVDHARMAKSAVTPGDLVTVRTGYPGTTAVVPESVPMANCIDIIISRPREMIRSDFLALWINSDRGKGQVLRAQGGLAQQHFNVGELKQLLVPVPPLPEQDRICAVVASALDRIRTEEAFAAKLESVRHGLMGQLLTGRVRVPELLSGRRK